MFYIVWAHGGIVSKKVNKIFGRIENKYYLCHRYPENNLFTLKETNTY